jgi:hypothetical protein
VAGAKGGYLVSASEKLKALPTSFTLICRHGDAFVVPLPYYHSQIVAVVESAEAGIAPGHLYPSTYDAIAQALAALEEALS